MLPYAQWLVWATPLIGAALIPLIAWINGRLRDIFAVLVGFTAAAFGLSMIPDVLNGQINTATHSADWILLPSGNNLMTSNPVSLNLTLSLDPLSIFAVNVAVGIGSLIVLYSLGYMAHEEGLTRYYFLVLLFIGGMAGMVMAGNFLQLYIFWEVMGLCSYALIGFWYKRPSAVRAGMKAFITTRVGDVFLLLGIIAIYFEFGSFEFSAITRGIRFCLQPAFCLRPDLNVVPLIAFLFLGGAVGKSAQIPLHVWLPDAMEGPTTVSALIHAATMVKAGLYLVARSFFLFSILTPFVIGMGSWYTTVTYIGAITMFLAATMAIVQTDLKRVLAYSTISQLGLIMTALGFGYPLGDFAGLFHFLSHSLFKSLLFLSAGAIIHAVGTNDMTQMGGLRKEMPFTFLASFVGVLALAGIPPANGFWSKDLIFASALEHGELIPLSLIWLGSILTAAYAVRWLYLIFFGKKSSYLAEKHIHEAPWVMRIPLLILAAGALISGFLEVNFANFLTTPSFLITGVTFTLEAVPLTLSLGVLVVGAGTGYLIYFRRLIAPEVIRANGLGLRLHTILWKGYYFDAAYQAVFVDGTIWLCRGVYRGLEYAIWDQGHYVVSSAVIRASRGVMFLFELGGLDRLNYLLAGFFERFSIGMNWIDQHVIDGFVNGVAGFGQLFSRGARRIQTGLIQFYVLLFIFGIVFILLFILGLGGI